MIQTPLIIDNANALEAHLSQTHTFGVREFGLKVSNSFADTDFHRLLIVTKTMRLAHDFDKGRIQVGITGLDGIKPVVYYDFNVSSTKHIEIKNLIGSKTSLLPQSRPSFIDHTGIPYSEIRLKTHKPSYLADSHQHDKKIATYIHELAKSIAKVLGARSDDYEKIVSQSNLISLDTKVSESFQTALSFG